VPCTCTRTLAYCGSVQLHHRSGSDVALLVLEIAARTAALRVVDRTDGFSTRPLSDPSWYLPRASSQRRGLPSSCVVRT